MHPLTLCAHAHVQQQHVCELYVGCADKHLRLQIAGSQKESWTIQSMLSLLVAVPEKAVSSWKPELQAKSWVPRLVEALLTLHEQHTLEVAATEFDWAEIQFPCSPP